MTSLLLLAFIGPLSWVYHPHVMVHGHCIAEAGSIQALYCEAPHKPIEGYEANQDNLKAIALRYKL